MDIQNKKRLELIAAKIRKRGLQMVKNANSGHIGGSFSMVEIVSVLYFDIMNVNPHVPDDPNRDRFVLSKGHCTPAVYPALAMKGYFPDTVLNGFRKIDSDLSGHMEMTKIPGVDMSTGSLGQGFSCAAGMALAGQMDHKDYYTYVVLGDGEIEEGQVWETAMFAGNHHLNHLIAIIDSNKLQLDGPVNEIENPAPIDAKFRSFGWNTLETDGNDVEAVEAALLLAQKECRKPTAIIANTIKGKGVSIFENQVRFHGGRPTEEEYDVAFRELDEEIKRLEVN